jgi:signal transduction histidine kinase
MTAPPSFLLNAPASLLGLLDRLPIMLGYWDAAQRNGYANRSYVDWFGAAPEWLRGRHLQDLLGPALYASVLPHVEAALRGDAQQFDRSIVDPQGVPRHSHTHFLPDLVQGQVRGFYAVVEDHTARKALEDAMAREQARARDLAQALEQRDRAEGESAQLRALIAERDRMLAEREDLLRFLAHEVRQPLNNASAALQAATAALAQPGTQQACEPLERAEQVLHHVIGALNNNLAAATVLVTDRRAQHIDTDLQALLDTVLHDLDGAQRQRVRIDHGGCSARTVQLQPGLVRLALCNLLKNALHYSPGHEPVQVRVYDTDEPLSLSFEVIDRGDGLPRAVLDHPFDQGPRPGARSPRLGTGPGLGLYLVHQIVRLHGGSVTVADRKPKGTLVRMTLPQGVAP